MITTDNGQTIEIRWEKEDTRETKQIIDHLLELGRILVMLSKRTQAKKED